MDKDLFDEAVKVAKEAEVAVVFVGLPETYESEGYDRSHMGMPWIENVKGILECYLAGQAVGAAQVNILFGKVNPSGKLAETFPKKLSDNPTHPYYGKDGDNVIYREGVFSKDIILKENLNVESTVTVPYSFTRNSTFGDIFAYPEKSQAVMSIFENMGQQGTEEGAAQENQEMMQAMMKYSPLRSLINFMGMPDEALNQILDELNS